MKQDKETIATTRLMNDIDKAYSTIVRRINLKLQKTRRRMRSIKILDDRRLVVKLESGGVIPFVVSPGAPYVASFLYIKLYDRLTEENIIDELLHAANDSVVELNVANSVILEKGETLESLCIEYDSRKCLENE